MPLHDHFHGPLRDERWESIHGMWAACLMRDLVDRQLPSRYRVLVTTKLGQFLEVDLATLETTGSEPRAGSGNGVVTTIWASPQATQILEVEAAVTDTFEIQIFDGRRLVATVELVSPGNKDRPENRRAFAVKCASYLRARVSVVIVDIVTDRNADLYAELLSILGRERGQTWPGRPPLYTVALKNTKCESGWRIETWEVPLTIGQALPTMPLWLADDLAVQLELESTYTETCRLHHIP